MAVSSVTGWAAPTMAVVASAATAWGAGARLCRMTQRSPWLLPCCDILFLQCAAGGDPSVVGCDASEGCLGARNDLLWSVAQAALCRESSDCS